MAAPREACRDPEHPTAPPSANPSLNSHPSETDNPQAAQSENVSPSQNEPATILTDNDDPEVQEDSHSSQMEESTINDPCILRKGNHISRMCDYWNVD